MQTQINPALAAAMTLERAAQAGQFQPTTPQGQPTVAAQLMQQAMPPSVPQIAQQAGLGAQIQAMQQQQAQQAMMQQAMAQRPPAGIEGLNSNIQGFKEGGIVGETVGYAKAGSAKDKEPEEEDGLLKYFLGIPAAVGALAGGQELAGAAKNARELVNLARYGSMPAQAGTYAGAANPLAVTGLGGLGLSALSTEFLAGRPELRQAFTREDTPLLGADPSGMALASAILEEGGKTAQARRAAQEPKRREPPSQESLPQADYSNGGRNYPTPLAALERFPNVQAPGGQRQGTAPAREGGGPPSGGSPTYAGMFNAARARLGQQALGPVDPREGVSGAMAIGEAEDELRRQMGLPTRMELLTKEGEEFRKLYGERGQRLADRISQLEGERGQQGIINFLLGARGMRGQGIGETFRTGAESARAYEEATKGRIEKMQDLQLEVRGLQLEKDTALAKMKDDIANGRFKDALANKQKAQDAQNGLLRAYAEIDLAQGKEMASDYREQLRLSSSAADRAEARKGREQGSLIAQLTSADAKITSATQTIEKVLKEKFPMAVVYNMNPQEAMKTDPEGVKAYLREEQRLRKQVLEPLERDRDNIRNQLSGYGGWGNLTVSPSKK